MVSFFVLANQKTHFLKNKLYAERIMTPVEVVVVVCLFVVIEVVRVLVEGVIIVLSYYLN